ncbi:MAG: hypothetical protein ACXAD7_13020 [Candidatus Kariarchaeaceae archaeon]|jgi:hypothetical protein
MTKLIPEDIWNELITVAKEDGVISNDEEILLSNIETNLERYYESMREDESTNPNKLEVLEAQLNIMRNAYDKAYEDGVISKDEFELLKKLQKIVRKIDEQHSYEFDD